MSSEIDSAMICILYGEFHRIRFRPLNPNSVDWNCFSKIEYHPLRMKGVGFPSVGMAQIGVAFPECGGIPVIQPRIPVVIGLVDCITPSGKLIAMGEENRIRGIGFCIGSPVPLMVLRVTPDSPRVPVPCIDCQLRAQTD